jgi:DNA invertase Pin-like site-specific DNA recombinase
MIFKQQHYYAGLYGRLSDEDDNDSDKDSCSIESQRKIMEQFCEAKNIQVVDFYKDDGWSGTNFDRPDFQRLLSDIKRGKINLVIVKDLSRFGRNYVDSGYYIENVFDDFNVRFIAIDDGVDTLQGENMVMPIKNMMNDFYAKDISKKTVSALNARAKSGQYLASKPAYGYAKDSVDSHQLVVDLESAEIVQRIFQMASMNHGYGSIVKRLTEQRILTPQSYFVTHNPDYFKKMSFIPHCQWNIKSVQVILNNPIYLGKLVYGKTRSKKVRSKNRLLRPEEEWIVRDDTHEAIISQDLWDEAHEKLNSRKREDKCGDVHIFSGYIFCKDCGASMTFWNRELNKELNGEFVCGSYKRKGKEHCTTHYVTYENIYNVLLADIRAKAALASQNEKRFMRTLEQENDLLVEKKASAILKDEQKARIRIAQLDQIISKLYEDSALGVIPQERFATLFSKYDSEQINLKRQIEEAESIQKKQSESIDKIQVFTEIIKESIEIDKLTPDILNRLIKQIRVGQAVKNPVTNEKQQSIEIEFAICA